MQMDIRKSLLLSIAITAAGANAQVSDDPLNSSSIQARAKIFGSENVDSVTGETPGDKVIFSWLSNSTFAASIEGRVVLLDTFVTRLEVEPGRTPVVVGDMVDLRPEAILLGHGHGDHANNAAYIAGKTGAVIYASEETCGVMRRDFERISNDPLIQSHPVARFDASAALECVDVTTADSVPGTEVVTLPVLEPQACVIAFRHLHSIAVPPDDSFPPTPVRIIVDPRDEELFPRGTPLTPEEDPLPGQMDLTTFGNPGGGVSIFYSFVLRGGENFTFVWHNTAGALKEGKGRGWDGTPEDGRRIIAVLESLPPTDVQMGTASSGNFNNNGLRDLIMYQEALQPRIYIPNHITSGTATREASSLSVYAGYIEQLQLMGRPREEWPEIRWLIDPTDYLKPIAFDTTSAAWANPRKQDSFDRFCAAG